MREPGDRALVLFEHGVDMIVWFRDDSSAAEARRYSGSDESDEDERWFRTGDYDSDPLCWASVLRTEPNREPILLVRAP
jgi:hypothetical protein